MKIILDYLLSILYYLFFGLFLCIFHPIQWLAFKLLGSKAQQRVVQWLNACLHYSLIITGTSFKLHNMAQIKPNRPLIIVSNHQSMFDIIHIIWHLRSVNPIFVSKKELAKGIPSISLNLRLSGAALINRKDSRQAIPEIARMAAWAKTQHYATVIFPEGTRSKLPQIKPFAQGGLAILLKNIPNAQILPIAIKGNNVLDPNGFFPLRAFTKIEMTLLPIVEPTGHKVEDLCNTLQHSIATHLGF
jgi:1-acyl-sn-glycerol-3-phosphate acyltransferase